MDDHAPCLVMLLDVQTGATAQDNRFGPWWWAEGNGSCDCNRRMAFGEDDESGHCVGCHRYLIVACNRPDWPLPALNHGYPPDLLNQFLTGR